MNPEELGHITFHTKNKDYSIFMRVADDNKIRLHDTNSDSIEINQDELARELKYVIYKHKTKFPKYISELAVRNNTSCEHKFYESPDFLYSTNVKYLKCNHCGECKIL